MCYKIQHMFNKNRSVTFQKNNFDCSVRGVPHGMANIWVIQSPKNWKTLRVAVSNRQDMMKPWSTFQGQTFLLKGVFILSTAEDVITDFTEAVYSRLMLSYACWYVRARHHSACSGQVSFDPDVSFHFSNTFQIWMCLKWPWTWDGRKSQRGQLE